MVTNGNPLTDHLDLWTSALLIKSAAGRGNNGRQEAYGIKKLRELILELAVRGKLVPQDPAEEKVDLLLRKIAEDRIRMAKEGKIKKPKELPQIEDDEKPFSLPNGWGYVRLNGVGEWGAGATPLRSRHDYYGGYIPWFKSGELGQDYISESEEQITEKALKETSLRYNKPGDVLVAMYGATIGKTSILTVSATTNQAVCACTPFSGVTSRFLLTLLKAYKNRFIDQGAGGAQPNISREKIVATVIALPPTAEQHRIVVKVDELMDLCDRLEQQQTGSQEAHQTLVETLLGTLTQTPVRAEPVEARPSTGSGRTEFEEAWTRIADHFDTLFTTEHSIDQLKQTILQLAVMGKLVPQDPNDEPVRVLLKRISEEKARLITDGKIKKYKPLDKGATVEPTHELPNSWIWIRLEDIVDITSGITLGRKLHGKRLVTMPYLRVANVQRGYLELDELKEIEVSEDELEKYTVLKCDLLITEGGDWDKVGRTAVWRSEVPRVVHQNHVFKARCILKEINELWLEKYLNSEVAKTYFAGSSKQTTNLASINKTQLRCCPVALPPTKEQHRIVAKVDELMALCDTLKARLKAAQATQINLADAIVELAAA